MSDDELDVELLMWDIHRRIQVDGLPDGETVLSFSFSDLDKYQKWWMVISSDDVDLCTEDPGKDIDLYIASDLRTMVEVWQGDIELKPSLSSERIVAVGDKMLLRSMEDWFGLCQYADVRPAE